MPVDVIVKCIDFKTNQAVRLCKLSSLTMTVLNT